MRSSPATAANERPEQLQPRSTRRLNHEFQVTGVGGVPATGVSAVLLNVTATERLGRRYRQAVPEAGQHRVVRGPDRRSRRSNPAGSLIVWGQTRTSPTWYSCPWVSAGGSGSRTSPAGRSHLIADVVGWFDASQPGQSGSGLTAVTPDRFLDTRLGIGGPRQPVRRRRDPQRCRWPGAGPVPGDATAVVGTVTGVTPRPPRPTSRCGRPGRPARRPRSSTSHRATCRPNLVTVGVGADGSWSFYNDGGNHDVLFDAVGYFRNGSGGLVTPVPGGDPPRHPGRNGGPRQAFGAGEPGPLQIAGRGGVPANATAVYLSVTASFGSATSYLTVWNGGARPATSNLNWDAGEAKSNLVLVPLGPSGTVQVFNASGRRPRRGRRGRLRALPDAQVTRR